VLANRLTENPKNYVLLIDARGGDSWWISKIHMPTAPAYPLGRGKINWAYELEPDRNMNNCRLYWLRKKVLGGSSSFNGMAYVRGGMDTTMTGGLSRLVAVDSLILIVYHI
jgi:choline dehydrogenase